MFEIITRAVIIRRGKLLLCRMKGRNYYFLPGGHLEFGEDIEKALKRELFEESRARIARVKLIGVVPNIFKQRGKKRHEFNFIFRVSLVKYNIKCVEPHIEYHWIGIDKLAKTSFLPLQIKNKLLNLLK